MVAIQGTLSVELEKRGPLTLRPGNYVASGGEGSVYRAEKTIIKLYTDPTKMRREGMAEKVKLLSQIRSPYIVAPEGVVSDVRGEPIGFYMPYVEGEALSRVFTTAFWHRESFDLKQALTLVERMRETVQTAHAHRAIMVDANELNWIAALKRRGGPEPRAIDVDSWAIGKWKASVIMPSIRDWHAKTFDEKSDWFSFGIVSFQVLTGIHPYRGTLDGYDAGAFEERMKANASVFRKGVRLNRAVRDFGTIPAPLLDWYMATFEQGERNIPPSAFAKGVAHMPIPALTRRATAGTGKLVFDKLFERAGDPVVRVYPCGVILLSSGALVEVSSKQELLAGVSLDTEVIKTPDGYVIADLRSKTQQYTFVDGRSRQATALQFGLVGHRIFRYENRLFLVTDDELIELQLMVVGKPLLTIGKRTQVLRPNATNWLDGLGVQKAFGATFVVLPFGLDACTTVRVRELDSLVPIAGVAGNRFASVVGVDKTGSYFVCNLTFNADYSSYQADVQKTDSPDLNVTLLPKGVGASIVDDGQLNIFVPTRGASQAVIDTHIATDMVLAHIDDTVVYVHNGALWSVKMT